MKKSLHEVVGVFTVLDKMDDAIRELGVSGFSRLDISVLGSQHAMKEAFGKKIPETQYLGDSLKTPRSANIAGEELAIAQGVLVGGGLLAGVVSVVIVSGGLLASGIAISLILGGTAGTAVGAFLAIMQGEKYASFFQKQIDSGGLLLWVRTSSKKKEEIAHKIFKKYGAHDVHVHVIK
jgi:hypothetical protein